MRTMNLPNTTQLRSTTTNPNNPTATARTQPNAVGNAAHIRMSFSFSFNLGNFQGFNGVNGAVKGGGSSSTQGAGVLSSPSNTSLASSGSTGSLVKDPAGWPKGSVKTSGGYTVVPHGDTNWSVFGPDQKPTDKPQTYVWGDPHVHESDGTKWDFTKSSTFRLPDGTSIGCQTTSEIGQSVSKRLDIVNGDQHVSIDGLDTKTPTTSEVNSNGFEMRQQLDARNDQFVLDDSSGAPNEVRWLRERNGQIEGLITGSTQDAQKTYDQTIQKLDANGQPFTAPTTGGEAQVGADAGERSLRELITKLFEGLMRQLMGGEAANGVNPAANSNGTSSGGQNGQNDQNRQTQTAQTGRQPNTPVMLGSDPMPEVNTDAAGSLKGLSDMLQALVSMASLVDELKKLEQLTKSPSMAF